MDHNAFRWTETETAEPPPAKTQPLSLGRKISLQLRPYLPMVVLMGVLTLLYLTRNAGKAAAQPADGKDDVIEAVMPLLPISKGQIIDFGAFEKVGLRAKSLSSAQRVRVVRSEHIANLTMHLKAKKMLAPHQIVLWSDLESAPETPGLVAPTLIRYGN